MNYQAASNEVLQKELLALQKAAFQIFGKNAKREYNVIADELFSRGITEIPNIFGAIPIRKYEV